MTDIDKQYLIKDLILTSQLYGRFYSEYENACEVLRQVEKDYEVIKRQLEHQRSRVESLEKSIQGTVDSIHNLESKLMENSDGK